MADGLNQVTLVGNIGADPEMKHTSGGGALLQFRLATTESWLDQNRNRQERTEWHNVVVWGRRGEGLAKILRKGSKICVVGSLRTDSWDGQDGTKRYRTQVVGRNVVLCGGAPGGASSGRYSAPEADEPPAGYNYGGSNGADDDDIPF